jgi:hypothetical protein
MPTPVVPTGEIQTRTEREKSLSKSDDGREGLSWGVDEINRHNGSGHRMAFAALLSHCCVGDGWSIHQETLE